MMTTADELVAAIADRPDLPLTDDEVRAQSEHFYPGTWRSKWPGGLSLPATLAAVSPGDRTRQPVTRTLVFERAENVTTEDDALDLYVLMCGWGAGWQGLTGFRSRKPLSTPGIGAALLRSYQEVRGGGDPVSAYRSLHTGQNKIKFFGPAFFTKWLYFAGYESTSDSGRRPLILDARVARTLGWATADWSSSDYGRYLDLASEAADGLGTTPHVIEHALYALNGDFVPVTRESDAASIVIQDVPAEVLASLESQADAQGLSVEELALQLLAARAGFQLEELTAVVSP